MKKLSLVVAAAAVLAMAVVGVYASTTDVRNTKHNLSTSGTGTYKSTNYTEICVFCHTPHGAGSEPLWNRTVPSQTFTFYSSRTFNSKRAAWSGGTTGMETSTKLCLSCHFASGTSDGAVRANLLNPSNTAGVQPSFNFGNIHYSARSFDADLTNDHPVGFNYEAVQAVYTDVYTPAQVGTNLGDTTAVIFPGGYMTCNSCHEVHGKILNTTGPVVSLLRRSNASSKLCLACHAR